MTSTASVVASHWLTCSHSLVEIAEWTDRCSALEEDNENYRTRNKNLQRFKEAIGTYVHSHGLDLPPMSSSPMRSANLSRYSAPAVTPKVVQSHRKHAPSAARSPTLNLFSQLVSAEADM